MNVRRQILSKHRVDEFESDRAVNRRLRRYDLSGEVCEALELKSYQQCLNESDSRNEAWRKIEGEPDFLEWYPWYKAQCH